MSVVEGEESRVQLGHFGLFLSGSTLAKVRWRVASAKTANMLFFVEEWQICKRISNDGKRRGVVRKDGK
jgi:hypothetical protein